MSVHDLRRAIEPLKARARDQALLRRRPPGPDPELLARLESAVAAAQSVEQTLGELAEVLTGLLPFRRLGFGGWVVGVTGGERVQRAGRRPRLAFTRIEVCVALSEDGRALELACHRSVLDHDLEVLHHRLPLSGAETQLAEWLEAAGLEFAEALLRARAG